MNWGCKMEYAHSPVLLEECIQVLQPRLGKLIVDCTVGLGGHSEAILNTGAKMVCIDKDSEALEASKKRLISFSKQVVFVRGDFRELAGALDAHGIKKVDGVLMDLGVSSLQLDKPERGFSYRSDAPVDMRMDDRSDLTAMKILNTWPVSQLKMILYEYGEERYAPQISAAIEKHRPINTTGELCELILRTVPAKARRKDKHPARRTFQALRIAVNDEMGALEQGLAEGLERLKPGGRMAVISFHSIEDRIVKQFFAIHSRGCVCPTSFPECACGKQPQIKLLKRCEPGNSEIENNPRAASARLRGAEKL
ncbi:MAG: 16S rRNA (cytosine(1402)-N(4))-methyltransferase RsmH [Oscillospiraceae bacterium]|nr:16S rRNA (cytosine(1402)-N(4))-methyltransferase RsmH [Oscillospiraceae bacterium]